jgi:hypothetical protein
MKIKSFVQDETVHWNIPELPEGAVIKGIYVYDPEIGVHCCELALSYECYKVGSYVSYGEDYPDDELLEQIDTIITENDNGSDVSYYHCNDIDVLKNIDVEGDFDNIEDAIEYVHGNMGYYEQ